MFATEILVELGDVSGGNPREIPKRYQSNSYLVWCRESEKRVDRA